MIPEPLRSTKLPDKLKYEAFKAVWESLSEDLGKTPERDWVESLVHKGVVAAFQVIESRLEQKGWLSKEASEFVTFEFIVRKFPDDWTPAFILKDGYLLPRS